MVNKTKLITHILTTAKELQADTFVSMAESFQNEAIARELTKLALAIKRGDFDDETQEIQFIPVPYPMR